MQGQRKAKWYTPGDEKFGCSHKLKTNQLSKDFFIINDAKFQDAIMKTSIGVVIRKTILFGLHCCITCLDIYQLLVFIL
jgi:hypothetical protein